ncbi:hypothetical protein GM418_23775 [Maribellus comscasis]|uniref:Sulfotransferase n=1 Tax=Maribellus comscasis TaxID=2681766 RepID=A0A6I6K256_9BACT|nr:sulfotransferase [Maribellus comscasis]QGY46567.1 hypothetical protein GM418_23775 [Maribellus comscasis]
MKEPIIISGLSGSGTRVVVRILEEVKFSFGYDVNISKDDLSFTLLFKLPKHYFKYFEQQSDYVKKIMSIHNKLLLNKRLNLSDLYQILKLSLLHIIQFRRYKPTWIFSRVKNIFFNRISPIDPIWGWKEPHSVPFLPDIKLFYPNSKFILIIRNGLDMVYSKNDQQFYNYAHYFGLDSRDESPRNRFELWYRFNKYAIEKGKELFKENFLIIYYENIANLNYKTLKKTIEFIGGLDTDEAIKTLKKEISNPGTINRYKDYDQNWISSEILSKLEEIGYSNLSD